MNPVEVLNADGTRVRSGRTRRRERARRHRAGVARVLAATAALVVAGLVFHGWVTPNPGQALPVVAEPARFGSSGERATRVVHPFSIVPGGVHDAGDAREAAAVDPVVAAHYDGIAIDALRLELVTRPRAVFVSYRRGNNVFWTKRRLLLHPGETLLSDGKNEVRARCGNRVSDSAQDPVSAVEDPTSEVFDQSAPIAVPEELASRSFGEWQDPGLQDPPLLETDPILDSRLLSGGPASGLVPGFVIAGLVPGLAPLVPGIQLDRVGDPRAFEAVPEPGTLVLVGLGLAGLIVRLRRTGARRTVST